MEVGAANELPADIPWDRLESARGSGSPFTARIGVKVAPLGPGESIALLPAAASLTARDGRLHEGALAALVDCAGGAAAWSADGGFDPRGRAATVGMHLGYDVSPRDEDVVARAYTPWRAAGIFVHAVSLWGRRSGRPIASGSVTYRVERPG
jgi:acyl-coenzyme A thioesterase PaaI-like protein